MNRLADGWEPDAPEDDTVLRQSLLALTDRMGTLASRLDGRRADLDGAAMAALGSASLFDNVLVLLRPPSTIDLAHLVGEARRFFDAGETWLLFSAWPTPDLVSNGLSLIGHPPFMLRPAGPAPPVHQELEIVAVGAGTAGADDLRRTMALGFPELADSLAFDDRSIGEPLHLWVGYHEGQPVSASGAWVGRGVVDVACVATRPEARGRGFGEAMTWQATSVAPHLPATLIASDDGRSVYQRMGYLPLTRFTLWYQPVS